MIILILLMSLAISCSPVREALQKVLYFLFEDHIEVQMEDELYNFQEESFLNIPEGYHKIYENLSEENNTYDIVYENSEGENIFYSQSAGTNQTSVTWNEDDVEVISDNLLYISDGHINTIILKRSPYTYSVSASLDKSILLKIIEQLREK